ncbi:hypothetical protein PVAP13_2NG117146 [Panicum virgatum]|uniref:Uncharacterized protein n=1 Tax=Panicum virgatum TaxID=38727 RepID=A0A8T0VBC1_PANVG|nr:hypothetical protein PVAP13_2NG117146 [Panicum virgatum]
MGRGPQRRSLGPGRGRPPPTGLLPCYGWPGPWRGRSRGVHGRAGLPLRVVRRRRRLPRRAMGHGARTRVPGAGVTVRRPRRAMGRGARPRVPRRRGPRRRALGPGRVVHVQPGVLAGSAQNTLYDVYGAAAHGGLLGGFNPFVRGATEPGVFWDLSGLRFPGSAADDPDLLFGGAVGAFVGGVAYPTSSRDAGLGIGLGAQVFAGGVAYPAASWGAGLGLGDQAFAGGVAYPAAPWGAGLSLGAQAFAHPGDQPFVAGAGNPHAFWVAGRGGGQPSSSSTSGRLDGFGAPVKWHTAWRRELAVPPWRGGEPADMIPAYRGERNVLGAGGGGVQRGQAGLPPAPVRRCGIGRAGRGHGAPPVAPAAVPAPRPAHVPRALPAGAARPQTPAGQGRQARRREAQQRLAYQPPPQEADHDPATRVVRPPEGHGVFRTAQ